jgi:hypothetical protein
MVWSWSLTLAALTLDLKVSSDIRVVFGACFCEVIITPHQVAYSGRFSAFPAARPLSRAKRTSGLRHQHVDIARERSLENALIPNLKNSEN